MVISNYRIHCEVDCYMFKPCCGIQTVQCQVLQQLMKLHIKFLLTLIKIFPIHFEITKSGKTVVSVSLPAAIYKCVDRFLIVSYTSSNTTGNNFLALKLHTHESILSLTQLCIGLWLYNLNFPSPLLQQHTTDCLV